MFDKFKKHIGYYLSLIVILIFALYLVVLVSPDRQLQMSIFIVITIIYVFWGILHHLLNHDLSSKIVIEYTLVGALGMSIILFLFKGGFGL
ncbi:MAG TPA: hypothetical protein VFD45_00425 [Patescibacteria group bacterium]|nr:hypothetical protein [Patescibacteria group bacterium]